MSKAKSPPEDTNTDDEDDDESEDESCEPNILLRKVLESQEAFSRTWRTKLPHIRKLLGFVLISGYLAYFAYAMYCERLAHEQSIRLCWVTCVVAGLGLLHLLRRRYGAVVSGRVQPVMDKASERQMVISW